MRTRGRHRAGRARTPRMDADRLTHTAGGQRPRRQRTPTDTPPHTDALLSEGTDHGGRHAVAGEDEEETA